MKSYIMRFLLISFLNLSLLFPLHASQIVRNDGMEGLNIDTDEGVKNCFRIIQIEKLVPILDGSMIKEKNIMPPFIPQNFKEGGVDYEKADGFISKEDSSFHLNRQVVLNEINNKLDDKAINLAQAWIRVCDKGGRSFKIDFPALFVSRIDGSWIKSKDEKSIKSYFEKVPYFKIYGIFDTGDPLPEPEYFSYMDKILDLFGLKKEKPKNDYPFSSIKTILFDQLEQQKKVNNIDGKLIKTVKSLASTAISRSLPLDELSKEKVRIIFGFNENESSQIFSGHFKPRFAHSEQAIRQWLTIWCYSSEPELLNIFPFKEGEEFNLVGDDGTFTLSEVNLHIPTHRNMCQCCQATYSYEHVWNQMKTQIISLILRREKRKFTLEEEKRSKQLFYLDELSNIISSEDIKKYKDNVQAELSRVTKVISIYDDILKSVDQIKGTIAYKVFVSGVKDSRLEKEEY